MAIGCLGIQSIFVLAKEYWYLSWGILNLIAASRGSEAPWVFLYCGIAFGRAAIILYYGAYK
jgi:hypothetical protein